jgi:hypothetical protein
MVIKKMFDFHLLYLASNAFFGSLLHVSTPKSYYCQKRFYSTLIQGIIDAKCSFWDYGYQWARSIHDWVFFPKKLK